MLSVLEIRSCRDTILHNHAFPCLACLFSTLLELRSAPSSAWLPRACGQHLHACQAGRPRPARPFLQQQHVRKPRREQRRRNQQQQLRKPRREHRRRNRPRAFRQHLHACQAGRPRPARPSLQQQHVRKPRREQRRRNRQQQLRKPRREHRRRNRPRPADSICTHARRAGLVRRARLCSSSICASHDGSRGAEIGIIWAGHQHGHRGNWRQQGCDNLTFVVSSCSVCIWYDVVVACCVCVCMFLTPLAEVTP